MGAGEQRGFHWSLHPIADYYMYIRLIHYIPLGSSGLSHQGYLIKDKPVSSCSFTSICILHSHLNNKTAPYIVVQSPYVSMSTHSHLNDKTAPYVVVQPPNVYVSMKTHSHSSN